MRVILTILAVALVTFLTAALVVPYLVDWSAHRAEIAHGLERLTGGRVTLTGPATLRLLPAPYLEVGAGSASGPGPDAPSLTFEGARLELALTKLASGAFRFTDVRLEKPVLTLARKADGSLSLRAASSTPADAIGADRFSVRDGTIRLAGKAGAPEWTIEGVELDGDAPTLAGPYHVSGRASGPGGAPIVFRLASEKAASAGLPVRVAVEAGPSWPALEFGGTFAAFGPRGPSAFGAAALTGTSSGVDGPTPWRAAGQLTADLDGARLAKAEFRFGPEERALRAEGSAALAYRGRARLAIDAKAKQMNLDALLRRDGEDGVPPVRAVTALSASLAPALAGAGPARLDARVAVETAVLGGDTLAGLSAALRSEPGKPLTVRFDFGLPGESRLQAEGEVETGAAPRFVGAIDFSTRDSFRLGRWAGEGAPEFGAWAQALADAVPASSLAISGRVEAAPVGLSGKNLKVALGRSILTGSLAVTRPVGADRGWIYADFAADSLDVETLPSLDAARSLVGDDDLKLSLDVKALRVAHVGEAGIDGASLVLELGKTGRQISLDRLAIAGLGGASVEATGALSPDGATATGRLDAARLTDFAELASRLAPGRWSRALVTRAPLLSPASIVFEASGGPFSEGGPALQSLKANGTIAGARAALDLKPAAKGVGQAFALTLESPDSGALLRQLGMGRAATPGAPGHVDLHASGAWGTGFDVDAAASLAGVALTGRGRYAPAAEGDDARLFGSFKLEGVNAAPLASILSLAPADGAIGPVTASADVTLRDGRWNVSRIAATVAGTKVTGALSYELAPERIEPIAGPDLSRAEEAVNGLAATAAPPPPPAVSGELSFDRLRLAELAALALGPPQAAGAGGLWSEARFSAPPLSPPAAAVRLNVGTLSLAEGLAAQGFSANLRLDRGRLDLDDVAMRLAGGAVAGRVTLRRSGESATLDGALTVEPLLVKRAGLTGRVGGRLDFASTGQSAAALIAGLAGGGAAEFSGAALPRSDPAALDRVVAAAQTPEAEIDETNVAHQFAAALDQGALAIPDGPAPIALSGGTIKLGPVAIGRQRVEATLNASLDLASLALETSLGLTEPAAGLKFWSGPPPGATVTVEDALGAPKRRLDVAGLAAGLATQAIVRESDRIASLEADIGERAFFNRRLKGERFLDRRNAEIEDWRAEQERLKGLAQRLREERAERERVVAEQAAAEKAAAEKAAAQKAAAEKADAERAALRPERQPEQPDNAPEAASRPSHSSARDRDNVGASEPLTDLPAPPPRRRPPPAAERSGRAVQPTAGGLY